MNCRGCRQRFVPLPDLSRKIEGDSVRRVEVSRTIRRCLFIVQTSDRIYAIFFLPYFTNIFCIFFLRDKFHPSSIKDDQSTRFPSTTNYKKKNNIKRLL